MDIQIIEVHKRKCGWPKEGGLYLVTDERSEDGTLAAIVLIDPPIPVQRDPHRGPILVDGQKILARLPEDEWVIGSSAKTVAKKRADEVWEEMFGMPLSERLSTGDCKGIKTGEEAYERILSLVSWNRKVRDYFRMLAIMEIPNLPNAAPVYNDITHTIQGYVLTHGADNNDLVRLAGLCWKLYYAVPYRKRKDLTAVAQLLAGIGLVQDAREMMLGINP